MVVSSKQETGGIEAPAVTIAASNPETFSGWKGKIENFTYKIIEEVCNDADGSLAQNCIEDKTYGQQELLSDVIIGWKDVKSVLQDNETRTYEDYVMFIVLHEKKKT